MREFPKDLEGSGHAIRETVYEIEALVPEGEVETRLREDMRRAVEALTAAHVGAREIETSITRLWMHLQGLLQTFERLRRRATADERGLGRGKDRGEDGGAIYESGLAGGGGS